MKINRKGFTLVELLVTIVIVGLVLALVVFGIFSAINNSKDKAKNLSEKSIKEAARVYSGEAGSDSWKKSNDYDFDAFCVTIGELMNKGLLDKDSTINLDNVDKNTYVIVKRNRVTLAVEKEEIAYENDINYGICTGTYVEPSEIVTKPSVGSSVSYTDRLEVSFNSGEATSGVNNYKCLYGDSSSNINREGIIKDNTCIATNLKNNHNYYIYIYMNTNAGTTVLAEGNNEYMTKDFSATNFSHNANVLSINYDNSNVYKASYYFSSDASGSSNVNVENCVLDKNGIFSCDGSSSTEIKANVWYRTNNKNVSITYPEETNEKIVVTSRIYDESNNSREDIKTFNIYKYTIKFYKNNASSVGGSTASYLERSCIGDSNGCSITSPSIVAPTGYSVVGFNTNKNANSSTWNVNASKNVNSNASYYAIIMARTDIPYKVQHWQQNIDAGTTQNSTNYTLKDTDNLTGTTGASITPSVKSYTGFKSPSTQTTTILADGSTVVNYYYTRKSFTVTLETGAGISAVSGNGTYHYEKSVTIDAIVDNGYTWSNWEGTHSSTTKKYTFTMPASNVNDTANASVITYKITYNLNGGTNPSSGVVTSYNVNTETFNLPTPSRKGYTFGGWYTSSALTGTVVTQIPKGSTGDKTFYANWNVNSFTVIYDANGGEGAPGPQIKYYGVTLILSTVVPTKTGYRFLGWSTDSNATSPVYSAGGEFATAISENITLYAVWTPITYTIDYKRTADDAKGNTSSSTHTYDIAKNLTANGFSRDGYKFIGWYDDYNDKFYKDKQKVINLTDVDGMTVKLYAQWQSNDDYYCKAFPYFPKYFYIDHAHYCCTSEVTDPDELDIGEFCASVIN